MRTRLLAQFLVATVAMVACSPAPSPTSTPTATGTPTPSIEGATQTPETVDVTKTKYAPAAATDGGTLRVGDATEANNFQPYYQRLKTEIDVTSATFAGLVVLTSDERYAPDLATAIPTIANGGVQVPGAGGDAMTVTWTLKDGLQWSDGQPLTCADFEFTWSWVMDKDNAGLYGGTLGYDQITQVDCPNPTTIVYHYRSVFEGYLTVGSLGIPLPQHYLESIPMKDQVGGAGWAPAEMPKVPTSGAFKFGSVETGTQLTLLRNPYYKGFASGVPAHLDSLVFKWYVDTAALIAGYVNGEVDVITGLGSGDLGALQTQGVPDSAISSIPSLTYEFLRPNWADGTRVDSSTGVGGCSRNSAVSDRGTGCPVSDPAFRQALALAINKDEINNQVVGGRETIATTNVAPGAYYADAGVTAPAFDPAQAISVLEAAGWTVPTGSTDGVRVKGGLKAKIELCSTTRPQRIATLGLIEQQLKAVGIEAIPNTVSPSDMFATFDEARQDTPCALSRGNFDLAEQSLTIAIDPINYYATYHSSRFEPVGTNDAQVADPDVDSALEAVNGTADFAVVKQAMATFQQAYVDKSVEIPLYLLQEVEVVSRRVGNFVANPTGAGPTWNVVDWYARS
jgi:peptide/nickel transport system substrate-binding protein